jgi:hypothetical protein
MPVRSHHTAAAAAPQSLALVTDAWETEVLPQLPADLAIQARTLKAFVRVRGIACVTDLLRALLAFALADHSTRSLGAWAVLQDLGDLSEAAWRRRLRKSNAWLGWLLSALLAVSPANPPPTRRRVRLIDATRLGQVGRGGDAWRVHWDYDLTAGRLGSVVVTDHQGGEHLERFVLAPDDIIVADNGYGYRRSVALVGAAGADGVFRIYPPTFPLEEEDGQPLDVLAWLSLGGPATREWRGWCRWKGQRYRVRLLAAPLPPEQAKQARKRKQRKARQHGRRTSTVRTRVLAGWLLLVTTLAEREWPAEAVLRLYRARWQVELVFKRLKQLLRVRRLRCKRKETAEATLRALLIAWVLQEDLATMLREALASDSQCPVSSWRVCQLSLETLRQEVMGHWTRARLRVCLPRLRRFLCITPRRRQHQETHLRKWLEQRSQEAKPALAAA